MQAIEAKPGNDIKNAPPETASPRLTCSLQEAADLTGLSYDYLHGQSKIANPSERLPGFKTGKSVYRVIVSELRAELLFLGAAITAVYAIIVVAAQGLVQGWW